MRPFLKRFLLAAGAVLLVAQVVPVRHDNPPSDRSKNFYTAERPPLEVEHIVRRSCNDCHSNETQWPWYSYVAPVSWIIAHDVHEARGKMNLSEWGSYTDRKHDHELEEICNEILEGDMPDSKYTLIHHHARVSEQERETICTWTGSPH